MYFFSNPLLFHFSDSILLLCVKFLYRYQERIVTGGCKVFLLVTGSTDDEKTL
jgi:hypothetical protein